jgi:biopolymer transport protein ExbD
VINFDDMQLYPLLLLALILLLTSCTPREEYRMPSQPLNADHYLITVLGDGDIIHLRGDKISARNRIWLSVDSTVQLNGKQLAVDDLEDALTYVVKNPDGHEHLPEARDSAVIFISMNKEFLIPSMDKGVKQVLATGMASWYPADYFKEGEDLTWAERPTVRIAPYFGPREDHGVLKELPYWSDEEPDIAKLNPRNVFEVVVNNENELFVRDKKTEISALTEMTKAFISNPENDAELAESPQHAIVSLKNERGTNYEVYLKVYNALKVAYDELWDEKSQELYGKPYSDDMPFEQRKAIRSVIPMILSEAEPVDFSE